MMRENLSMSASVNLMPGIVAAAIGSERPMTERKSSELQTWFASALNDCTWWNEPPKRKQQPAWRAHV
jgi:hypothetical protein